MPLSETAVLGKADSTQVWWKRPEKKLLAMTIQRQGHYTNVIVQTAWDKKARSKARHNKKYFRLWPI